MSNGNFSDFIESLKSASNTDSSTLEKKPKGKRKNQSTRTGSESDMIQAQTNFGNNNSNSIDRHSTKKMKLASSTNDTIGSFNSEPTNNDPLSSFGYVVASKLEYAARVLQRQIKLIIDEAPDIYQLSELNECSNIDQNTRLSIQQNHLIQLAAKLKTSYKDGKIPIFDQILNESVEIDASRKNLVSSSSSSPDSNSRPVSASVSSSTTSSSSGSDDDDSPVSSAVSPPVSQPSSFPSLPIIKSPLLYGRVFIHKSTVNNKSYLNQSEVINSHNERLEFLGDSVLNNLVTLIIYDRFPDASEGDMSKIRSSLVNNAVLTEFSIMYGFDKKLKSNIHDQFLRQGRLKIFADIFEAYIGALTIEHGFELSEIKDWLIKLMDSKLRKFDRQLKKVEQINKDAKSELYSLIGTAASHPQYSVIQTGDGALKPFIIRCTMADDILGEGVAPGLKEAGLRAAMKALKNKKLLEKYIQIRLNTDRAQSVIKRSDPAAPSLQNDKPTSSDIPPVNNSNSEIKSTFFPIINKDQDEFKSDAKNELYALLGHRIKSTPKYSTKPDEEHGFRSELSIDNFIVAIGYDKSKKKAATKAAMAFINERKAIDELIKVFHSKVNS